MKQSCVALGMAEAKYLAACAVVVWLRELLSGLFGLGLEATCIWFDNQSCMKSSENPVVYDKLKHIEIRYYYIGDIVQKGVVRLNFVTIEDQVADVFTKLLSRMKFEYFRDKLGVVPLQRECSHPT